VAQRKLNIGMIGAGFIGQLAHLMNYVEIKECRVLALAEYRPQLRCRVAQRFDIPRTYATHQALLQDTDVEAVVVVTPRSYTGPVVLDCLKAGKHVLSEKPMAGSSDQAQELLKCAAANRLHYVVGYMKRHDEGVQLARQMLGELVASGELGPLLFARIHCYGGDSYCKADGHIVTDEKPPYGDAGWPQFPSWMPAELTRQYAAFLNTYSHNTNLLRYLFGKTPEVEYARLSVSTGQIAILNCGAFVTSLETGSSSNRGWDETTDIFFADGRLTIRTPPPLLKNVPASVELYKGGAVQQMIQPQCNWTWAFRRQAQAFVSDILEGKPSLSSGEDALEDLNLIESMWRTDLSRTSRKAG
jgi:predicted dehydrogenase